jgi:hypothetical protein
VSALDVDLDQFIADAKAKLLRSQARADGPMVKAVSSALDRARVSVDDRIRVARRCVEAKAASLAEAERDGAATHDANGVILDHVVDAALELTAARQAPPSAWTRQILADAPDTLVYDVAPVGTDVGPDGWTWRSAEAGADQITLNRRVEGYPAVLDHRSGQPIEGSADDVADPADSPVIEMAPGPGVGAFTRKR